MLPAYYIEVLEYKDYQDDPQGTIKSKPHIVFEDKQYSPLAELLNWRFPDTEGLIIVRDYLLRPWHPKIQKRGIAVCNGSWTEIDLSGSVTIKQNDDNNDLVCQLELSIDDIISSYNLAIILSKQLR